MKGAVVGYKRVSSVDQSLDHQLNGIELDRVFEDKASGGSTNRPGLQAALQYMREGDTFVVHSMDRLSRSLSDMLKLMSELTGKGIRVRFIKEAVEFSGDDSPMQNLQLHLMTAVAEFERSMIRERQREGIAAAKARGKNLGPKFKLTGEQVEEIVQRAASGQSTRSLANDFGVGKSTIAAAIARVRAKTSEVA